MKTWQFQGILTETGWLLPGWVQLDDTGNILAVGQGEAPEDAHRIAGYALPGFQNAHSHAFQYAMAGIAEHLTAPDDDFWSWREAMYRLALSIDPDDMEAIAAMLYAEMVRHGYTSVAEFHYLHHAPDGKPYADPAEMGARLVAAAERAGIRLTLVPVFYQTGDFGKPALPEQRRFIFPDLDAWRGHLEASAAVTARSPNAALGGGLHSLRAARPEDVAAIFEAVPQGAPKHIHIAEQTKEVDTCLKVLGKRPVEWLMEHVDLDDTFHLVHATHMTEEETRAVARSGASVVLCPSTEGNLGDGFFNLPTYLAEGGSFSIGTDSHIGLSPMEELRWLDYGRRLFNRKRNVLCMRAGQDSGAIAYGKSLLGGRRAMGHGDA
ncbi:MAG: formimidoylglutamate deiminase, partial [Acidobacteriota bacterium]|nr:formimidoylglutamate deiminase [Acidobacteriota bacterium]